MDGKDLEGGETPPKALETLAPEKAFHFYRDLGQPLHASSRSLAEFATILGSVDPSSVKFHVERGDFEGWFTMIGDKSLADQLATLRGKSLPADELREKVVAMVGTRLHQLQHTPRGDERTGAAPTPSSSSNDHPPDTERTPGTSRARGGRRRAKGMSRSS